MGGDAPILADHVAFDNEFDDFAEGVHVGTWVGFFAFEQFGGDEFVFFDEQFVVGFIVAFGQSDVDDFGSEVVGGDDDVFGFEVAVDDAALVHIVKAVAEVEEDGFHLFFVEGTHADVFSERFAFDEFEDDAFAEAFDTLEADGFADGFMVELACDFVFSLQVIAALVILGKFGFQSLDNDFFAVACSGEYPARSVGRGVEGFDVFESDFRHFSNRYLGAKVGFFPEYSLKKVIVFIYCSFWSRGMPEAKKR